MSDLTTDDVQKILKIIDSLGDRDIYLELGELKLRVTRGGDAVSTTSLPAAAPAAAESKAPAAQPSASAPAAPAATVQPASVQTAGREARGTFEVPEGFAAVTAPSAGTFYRAPSPGAKPFVEIGDHVEPDDIVCVFDVMKLFTSLKADVAGTISAILVENQAVVVQGQPLILIKPDQKG